jgi:L-ascorbate metabolism protein UlaG (beta-lactamase superfamily)
VVLLSHNHYDHFDLVTLLRLHRDHRPRFLAGLGNAAFLARRGVHATTELDWWESTDLASGVRLTAVPAKHFSGRGTFDRDRTLWAGYVVTGPAGAVYFAGDTGFGGHFQEIHERFPSIRLAVLPIGAFRPEWFMSRVHVSPDQALRAHGIVRAGTSVAIHFGTFHLADDGQDEAPDRLRELLAQAPEPRPRFWVLGFGEGRAVPEAEAAG